MNLNSKEYAGMEGADNTHEANEEVTAGEIVAEVLRDAPSEKKESGEFMEAAANALIDTAQNLLDLGKSKEEVETVLRADLDKLIRF